MATMVDTILRRIRAKKRGWVFTPKDFTDIANRNLIDVALHRLVKKGVIRKIDYGIYDFPIIHPKLGALAPNPDVLAKALANKTGDTIHPSGARAANQLGIDMQVPAKLAYLTSRKAMKKTIANYQINLQHSKYTSTQKLNVNVVNTINALRHLGKHNISAAIIKQLNRALNRNDKLQIKQNLSKFPDWLAPILLQLTRTKHEKNTRTIKKRTKTILPRSRCTFK